MFTTLRLTLVLAGAVGFVGLTSIAGAKHATGKAVVTLVKNTTNTSIRHFEVAIRQNLGRDGWHRTTLFKS